MTMQNNGGIKREGPEQRRGSWVGIVNLALVCATILGVVYIIWNAC